MSDTRVFDYEQIAAIYKEMNQITGDASDPTSIAGLLNKIDQDYKEVVNGSAGEDALALYGDLGSQMLLNWENTAATFPAFVENFSAWSTAVAQTAGDYKGFEEQVKGIRTDNPLGWNSGGITDSYVASSVYANSLTHEELDSYAAGAQMYNLVGAYYVDTGMVSAAKKSAFWNGVTDILSVASIVASGCSIFKGVSALTSGAKAAGTVATEAGGEAAEQAAKQGVQKAANEVGGEAAEQVAKQGVQKAATEAGGEAAEQIARETTKKVGSTVLTETADDSIRMSVDDIIASGKNINVNSLGYLDESASAVSDKLIKSGYTLVGDTWQAPAALNGAPSAFTGSAFGEVADDLVTGSVDDLISKGYTLTADGWMPPATSGGAPVTVALDDLITSGKPINVNSLNYLDETAGAAADKLMNSGYTLVGDTWQAPASLNGAPSAFTGSAFGEVADDFVTGSVDDMISKGYTLTSDGWQKVATHSGAPSSVATSKLATGDLAKTVSRESITAVDKAGYYAREGIHTATEAAKSGFGVVKDGASAAGTWLKDNAGKAGQVISNAAQNGNLVTGVGFAASAGSTASLNSNMGRAADIMANTQWASVGSGGLRNPSIDIADNSSQG